MVGAEAYWVGVFNGLKLVDEYEEDFASIEALRAFRARVCDVTAAYLDSATDEDVNRVRMARLLGHPIPSGLDFPVR